MGVTAYLNELENAFLNQLKDKEIPPDLVFSDAKAVRDWVHKAFAQWFLLNRDELLAKKWVKRGWAEHDLEVAASGNNGHAYRLRPEFVEQINDWLKDQID